MLIDLLPDFFAVLESEYRVAAYWRYFEAHRALLAAYWDNYVVDPDGPHADEVVRATVSAERRERGGAGGERARGRLHLPRALHQRREPHDPGAGARPGPRAALGGARGHA